MLCDLLQGNPNAEAEAGCGVLRVCQAEIVQSVEQGPAAAAGDTSLVSRFAEASGQRRQGSEDKL